jgi:hypothetical protein
LISETNPKSLIEEANHFIGIREVFSISSMKNLKFKINQRRFETEGVRCGIQAFENNSAVGERSPVAETEARSTILNDRQRVFTECTNDSVYCKTCLESVIDPMFLIRKYDVYDFIASTKISSNNSSIYFRNRSFKDEIHHLQSSDLQVTDSMFIGAEKLYIFRAENKDSICGLK